MLGTRSVLEIRRFATTPLLGFAFGLCLIGCGHEPLDPADYAVASSNLDASEAPCLDREPRRKALFGDLHVHTALSLDAWNYDVRVRPSDAYRYAFGNSVRLPPNDAAGRGSREVRIDRPLDFAAITDHAESFGELVLCADPESGVYESDTCVGLRESTVPTDNPILLQMISPWPYRKDDVCGDDGERCASATRTAWQEIVEAAEEWNDTSAACERTAFIGFEYSSFRMGSNLHRNVIFRTSTAIRQPVSYVEAPREWLLWKILHEACIDTDTDCDALAIPHNSNISNGRMFSVDYPGTDGIEEQAARAALRMSVEPVVEVMQHKGDSECRAEMQGVFGAADELCGFEKMVIAMRRDDPDDPCGETLADWVPHLGPDCMTHRNYVRYALTEGLAEERRIGVNPFKFGLMASTDTHNGLAGGVRERDWPGHLGIADGNLSVKLSEESGVMGNMANGPGGLIGVWAEENSRGAIFDAIRRREVFGTSGPRIQPRFFGGWDVPGDICQRDDVVAAADAIAVPMGTDLPPGAASDAPRFVALASADPGSPGAPGGDLQRMQIIKGWVDDDGGLHEQVYDVAGGENGASVDPATCEPQGRGARQLCSVWQDPDFDAARRAVYYARAVENPSCRYSAWECLALAPEDRPSGCAHEVMKPVQQERAWTSPIWYTPPSAL